MSRPELRAVIFAKVEEDAPEWCLIFDVLTYSDALYEELQALVTEGILECEDTGEGLGFRLLDEAAPTAQQSLDLGDE